MTNNDQRQWFPALDGLRAIAALSVLIDHLYPPESRLQHWFHFGRFGVDIFFALSGFLIVGNLLRLADHDLDVANGKKLLEFYGKRALRIFPIYYLIIAILCIAAYSPVTHLIWWHLTYTSNIGSAFGIDFGNLSHFWSLCVEEQFYLIVPTLILFLSPRRSLSILVALCVIGTASKVTSGIETRDWNLATRFVFENLEGLTYGACVAYALRVPGLFVKLKKILFVVAIPAMTLLVFLQIERARQGYLVYSQPLYISTIDLAITLAFGPILLLCIDTGNALTRPLKNRLMRYLGRISYGTYVYHYALMPFYPRIFGAIGLNQQNPLDSKLAFFIAVGLTYALSAASWEVFERPILGLKRYFPSIQSDGPGEQSAVSTSETPAT